MNGLRIARNCIDKYLLLIQVQERVMKKKANALFMDLEKAYDNGNKKRH